MADETGKNCIVKIEDRAVCLPQVQKYVLIWAGNPHTYFGQLIE